MVAIIVLLGVVVIAAVYSVYFSDRPDYFEVPGCEFSHANTVSSNEVHVLFGARIGDPHYSDFAILVDPPGNASNAGVKERWNLSDGTSYSYNSTLALDVFDVNHNGMIDEGDYINIISSGFDLASGDWELDLFYTITGSVTNDISFAVQEP